MIDHRDFLFEHHHDLNPQAVVNHPSPHYQASSVSDAMRRAKSLFFKLTRQDDAPRG